MAMWRDPWFYQRKNAKTPKDINTVKKLDRILSNIQIQQVGTPISLPNLYKYDDIIPPDLPNGDLRDGLNIKGIVIKVIDLNQLDTVNRRINNKLGSCEVLGGTAVSYVVVPYEDYAPNSKTPSFENLDVNKSTLNFDPRVAHIYYQYYGEESRIAGQVIATQQRDFARNVKMVNQDNEYILFDSGKYFSAVLGGVINANPEYFPDPNEVNQEE